MVYTEIFFDRMRCGLFASVSATLYSVAEPEPNGVRSFLLELEPAFLFGLLQTKVSIILRLNNGADQKKARLRMGLSPGRLYERVKPA